MAGLPDLRGSLHYPLELQKARAAVVIFSGIDCPISNAYAPLINRLCEHYQAANVAFYIVHSEAGLTLEAARKHAKEFGYSCPVLLDRRHELARLLGATVTPEAAVVGRSGNLLYLGRIDDAYITLGQRRYEATTHELADAIEAVLAGKEVAMPRTRAVGCAIGD
jgi:hypothetical protein